MSVDNLVSYRDLELPRSRLGKGLFWPPQEDETTGDLKKADQEESITVCSRHLIETYIGEYPVIRTFGTRVEDLLFARVQDALLNAIYGSVREGIQKFEQRVDLINLILDGNPTRKKGAISSYTGALCLINGIPVQEEALGFKPSGMTASSRAC